MKDKHTLIWLYKHFRAQRLPLLAVTSGHALLAVFTILFALVCREVIDRAVAGNAGTLIKLGIGLLAVIILQFALRIFCRSLEARIRGRLEMDFRTRLTAKLLSGYYARTTRFHSGELMNRLTSDIAVVAEGTATLLPELAGLLTRLFGAIGVLYFFDPLFTLVLIAGGVLLFFTARYFRERLKHLHKTMQEKDGVVRSFMQEILESLVVVKTFGVEREMTAKTEGLGLEFYQARIKSNTVSILATSGFFLVFSLGYLFAMIWGAFGLLSDTLSYGTLTAVLLLVGYVQTPFTSLSGLLPKAYGIIASAERLIELEKLPGEADRNKEDLSVDAVYSALRGIRLENVSFRYDRDMVLNRIDLTIGKGDFVLVSGESGAGKSTLALLLLGIYTPAGGNISLELQNGERIPVDKRARKLFAYVPQNNLLFSGTIRENIAFVNTRASDEAILAAADISCAADFIRALPHGLDTVIGEKGLGLSQGQIQRLAIARAVLSGAPVLLLDEATSALDEATEERLLDNIRQMTDKTCIIISHKKAALDRCDKVVRLEGGSLKIRERSSLTAYGAV